MAVTLLLTPAVGSTRGFGAVRYERNLPLRRPSGLAILGVTALCAYGFYRVELGNIEKKCVVCEEARMCGVQIRGGERENGQVICCAQRGVP